MWLGILWPTISQREIISLTGAGATSLSGGASLSPPKGLCSIPARPIAPPCQRLHRCPIARHYSVISCALTLGTHHTTPLFSGNLWLIGKAGPGYCPLGPAIVTEDELGDPHNLVLGSWVNGERWQGSKTDQLVHRVDEAVSFISRCVGPIRVYVYRRMRAFERTAPRRTQ